jgi:organic hydroperoxide reductase OsmC/OhrA
MAEHTATVSWDRFDAAFTDNRYSRAHRWMFDGGATIPASASPHVVAVPLSDPMGVDPEEAFVASLSSCHMLWFLSVAAGRGFVVDRYEDHAVGTMAPDETGRLAMTRVALRPAIAFSGPRLPTDDEIRAVHDAAHHECFLARSVRTAIVIEMGTVPPDQ